MAGQQNRLPPIRGAHLGRRVVVSGSVPRLERFYPVDLCAKRQRRDLSSRFAPAEPARFCRDNRKKGRARKLQTAITSLTCSWRFRENGRRGTGGLTRGWSYRRAHVCTYTLHLPYTASLFLSLLPLFPAARKLMIAAYKSLRLRVVAPHGSRRPLHPRIESSTFLLAGSDHSSPLGRTTTERKGERG